MISLAFYYPSFPTDWHLSCNQGLSTEPVWPKRRALMNVLSLLIRNTWVVLAKRWMKRYVGNYLPIPPTWLTKVRNVPAINSYERARINRFFLGKGQQYQPPTGCDGSAPKPAQANGFEATAATLHIQAMSKLKERATVIPDQFDKLKVFLLQTQAVTEKRVPVKVFRRTLNSD